MSEIPMAELGGAGLFALLIIKEVRHWTSNRRNGRNGDGSPKLGERVASNETDIVNIKDVFKEQKADNTKEHNEIKCLIKTEIKTLKSN